MIHCIAFLAYSLSYSTQAPVLCKQEDVVKVNLHPTIVNMLEEAKWIRRLGFEVPSGVHRVSLANVKANYDQLKVAMSALGLQ